MKIFSRISDIWYVILPPVPVNLEEILIILDNIGF